MKTFTKISLLLIVFTTFSCSVTKVLRLMKKGEVEQENFKVTIPYEERLGLIVIKVTVNGKEHDFLLDTGAPNVLSTPLAVNIASQAEHKVSDSQGENSDLSFVIVDDIEIGGINFKNTGAAVADLNASAEIACLKVDGLIGSNLMRKAIWQFDLENKQITIASSMSELEISDKHHVLKFYPEVAGTPAINIAVGDYKDKYVAVDLGSNGGYNTSQKTFKKLLKRAEITENISGYGSSSAGLYGSVADSIFIGKVRSFQVGDLAYHNQALKFTTSNVKTLGTDYFKHFIVTINWDTKQLILDPKSNYSGEEEYSSFGIKPVFNDGKIFIGLIFNTPQIQESGLALGDQILQIDDKNHETVSEDELCHLIDNGFIDDSKKEIEVTVRNKDGEVKTVRLVKSNLLGGK